MTFPVLDGLIVNTEFMQYSRMTVAEHVGMQVINFESFLDALHRLREH